MTPLEIQSLQSREFEATKDIAFPSVVSVFQDIGYIIENADKEAGVITAASPTENTTTRLGALFGPKRSEFTKATAFIEDLPGGHSRVRLNFVVNHHRSGIYGQTTDDSKIILDGQIYERAFNRIDEAIFVRKGSS